MTERFINEDLLDRDEAGTVSLRGSRCPHCAATTFPQQAFCPRCARPDMRAHRLPSRGTLWTFTVQGFKPKPPYDGPEQFEPYAVGYLNLGNEVMVESRLVFGPGQRPCLNEYMNLVLVPYTTAPDGANVTTFAFQPAAFDPDGDDT